MMAGNPVRHMRRQKVIGIGRVPMTDQLQELLGYRQSSVSLPFIHPLLLQSHDRKYNCVWLQLR